MSLALIRKELREHGWVFAAVVLFDGVTLAVQLSTAGDQGGRFAALVRFAGVLTLSALVASNRLFAREYGGKTQLFLEVLPITRARVLATKWLLGAAFQGGVMLAAWAATLVYMRRSEVITLDDALRPLLATEAYTLAIWSFSAMAGLLGRYRYVAWMALCLFYFTLAQAEVPAADSPLTRLLSEAIAMARTPVPARSLVEALVMILGSVAVTTVLALTGSGSIAATLAKRMTGRERAFIVAATFVAVVAATKLKKEHELPPFELAAATRSTSSRTLVGVMQTDEVGDDAARSLGAAVARDVDTLTESLHLATPPSVFLLPQRGLEPTVTERATLTGAQGIVVRAAPDIEPSMLRSRVLHELLRDVTESRGLKEDRHALLDGLAVWWAVKDDVVLRERWWRRAAASRVELDANSIARWSETTERTGECGANALGFALVDTLVAEVGRDRVLELAAKLFTAPRTGLLAPLLEDTPEDLLKTAGTEWSPIAAAAEQRRLGLREPRPETAEVGVEGDVVKVRVTGVARWRALYGKLGPWSRGQTGLSRLDVKGSGATLPLTLSRGDRLLVLVEHDDDALGCPVRLEARRLEAP